MPRPTLPRRRHGLRSRPTSHPGQPCLLSGTSQKSHSASLTLEALTRLVVRALDTLPGEIAEKLNNVAVAIEDQPSAEVLQEKGLSNPHELFGLYRGVPRPWRSMFAPLSQFPDKIEIYYQSILRAGLPPQEIQELIRRVVVHEVGYHFGMSNQQIRALGY